MTSKQYLATKQPKPVEVETVEVDTVVELAPEYAKATVITPKPFSDIRDVSNQLTAHAAHWNRVATVLSASGHRSQDDMAVIYHAGWIKNIALDLADWTRAAKPEAVMPEKGQAPEPVVTTAHKRRTK